MPATGTAPVAGIRLWYGARMQGPVEQNTQFDDLAPPPALPPEADLPQRHDHLVAEVAAARGISYAEAEQRVRAATTPRDARGREVNRRCPVCQSGVHASSRGDWRCYPCGARGGTFTGERMYMTHVPDTPAGRAAQERLAQV